MFNYVIYSWSGDSEVRTTFQKKKSFNCWKTDYVKKNLKANCRSTLWTFQQKRFFWNPTIFTLRWVELILNLHKSPHCVFPVCVYVWNHCFWYILNTGLYTTVRGKTWKTRIPEVLWCNILQFYYFSLPLNNICVITWQHMYIF